MKYLNSLQSGLLLLILGSGMVGCSSSDGEWDATGVFESTEVLVSSEANGKIMQWNLQEGDVVSAGKMLGYVDTVQLSLKRDQLEASMRAAGGKTMDISKQVAATRRQIEQAELEVQRARDLLNDQAGTRKQVDDAEAQLAVLRRQLAAQLSTMGNSNQSVRDEQQSLELQIKQLEDQLQKCRISSPISGTVLTNYVEAGEITSSGRPLFKVADMKRVFLRAYVEAPLLTQIRLGQKVTVYADEGKDEQRKYEGEITWIASEAEFTPKTIQTRDERSNLVYAVKIAVENNDGKIKLGMYGNVDFRLQNKEK